MCNFIMNQMSKLIKNQIIINLVLNAFNPSLSHLLLPSVVSPVVLIKR